MSRMVLGAILVVVVYVSESLGSWLVEEWEGVFYCCYFASYILREGAAEVGAVIGTSLF